jgi:hypothetical protein
MRLLDFMDADRQAQPLCGPGRRPDARIVSPLPNLRLEPGAAVAEIVHHPLLEATNGSRLCGNATLRLRGEQLHVCVTADRPVHLDLRRCQGSGGDLLLVASACGAAQPACVSSASFDLSMRESFAELAEEDFAQLPAAQADALRHASLQGLPTRGWLTAPLPVPQGAAPSPAAASDRNYFLRRMKDEIEAALRAKEPGVASRHVQIATLLARRLQDSVPSGPSRHELASYFSGYASETHRLP